MRFASRLKMKIHALCLNTKIRLTDTPASLLCFQIKDLTYTPPVINKISKRDEGERFHIAFPSQYHSPLYLFIWSCLGGVRQAGAVVQRTSDAREPQ